MADSKITALGSIGTGTDPANDQLVIVDVSDVLPTGMATTGTTKRVSLNNLLACSPTATLASADITGNLTVRTNKFAVTSIGTGIGTATPTTGTLNITSHYILFSDSQTKIGDNGLVNGAGSADANTQIQYFGGKSLFFNEGVSTRMTLNSTGLGVGVAPSYKLHVSGRISYTGTIGEGADATLSSSGTALLHGNAAAWTSQTFYTGGTSRAVIKQNGQVRFVPLAADPASPESGDVYYNSTSNKLKCYNGTTWNDLF
jgi:hypothetical protein